MRSLLVTLVVFGFIFESGIFAQEAAPKGDILIIKNRVKEWADYFNSRNLEKVKEIYADDYLASYPNQPNQDLNLTLESFNHLFQNNFLEMKMSFKILEIESGGDLAYVRLNQVSEVKPKNAKQPQYGEDTGIQIWKKQPNGEWKLSRSVMYPMGVSAKTN